MRQPVEIPVLIADDSSLIRRALRDVLRRDPAIRVVGEARTGDEAVRMACSLRPQVITMDLEMPGMDGLTAIEQIMARAPTRILVVTCVPTYGGKDTTFEALARGALDLLMKPVDWPGTAGMDGRLVRRILELATVPVIPHVRALKKERRLARTGSAPLPSPPSSRVILIGTSTGGPGVVQGLFDGLPPKLPAPIVLVQHLSEGFTDSFIAWLGRRSNLEVREARPGMKLRPGTVDVVVRGPHMAVDRSGVLREDHSPPRRGHRPSIDVLFESAAENLGSRAIALLLTGMGDDGAAGLEAIRGAGGTTIAQDEETSVVFGMPKAAIERDAAAMVVGRADLPRVIVAQLRKP